MYGKNVWGLFDVIDCTVDDLARVIFGKRVGLCWIMHVGMNGTLQRSRA